MVTEPAQHPMPVRLLLAAVFLAVSFLIAGCGSDAALPASEADTPAETGASSTPLPATPVSTANPANPTATAVPTTPQPTAPVSTPAPTASPTSTANGLWAVDGYGYVVMLNDDAPTYAWAVAGDSCVVSGFPPIEVFQLTDPNRAIVNFEDTITDFHLVRTEFPSPCESPSEDATPSQTIEALISLMDERYPFFELREVDWPMAKADLRSSAAVANSPEEVENAISDFFLSVGDGHNQVISGFSDGVPADLLARLNEIRERNLAEQERVETMLEGPIERRFDDGLVWGSLGSDVGYLMIGRMAGFATEEDQKEMSVFGAALDEALTDLADHPKLIIDVRFNGGGSDAIALEAVGRFIDEPLDVFTKKAGSAAAAPQVITARPSSGVGYAGEVVALFSDSSASAAEIFGIALHEAGVTTYGMATEGITSDIIPFDLPGEIEVGISMEVYADLDGQPWEVRGVPIDVEAGFAETLEVAMAALVRP